MKRHVLISKQGKRETYVIVDAKTCTCHNFIYRKTCKHVDALNTTTKSF
jgi:predicted nucleic acid-binding Zn finger protein